MQRWLAIALVLGCGCTASDPIGDTGAYLQRASHREVTVAWRTRSPVVGRVEWGTDPAALDRVAEEAEPTRYHAVPLRELPPRTRVHYRYGTRDAMVSDPSLYFDVPPPPGEEASIRFWVLGDSGTGDAAQAAVARAMRREAETAPPDFLLHVGDIAYERGTARELVDRFFGVYADLLGNTVVWPALGNHEARSIDEQGTGPWFDFFVLPTAGEAGGVPSGTEAWYSFDRGPGHFVVLDSSTDSLEPDGPMLRWLEADLAADEARWTVAVLHHAPYSDGTHDADRDERMRRVRQNVVPILERNGVDLVFSGHSHGYERTALIAGAWSTPAGDRSRILDEASPYEKKPGPLGGTVYVVAGHGGRATGGRLEHPLVVADGTAYGFLVVEMDEEEVRVRNVHADGTPGDAFVLREAR